MKLFTNVISVRVLPWADLNKADQQLMLQAIFARHHAYCPYSGYAVGAALKTSDGDIAVGQNVENANWTATTHAEQSAVTAAINVAGPGMRVASIAIVGAPKTVRISSPVDVWGAGPASIEDIFGPCGHCRQILLEFADADESPRVMLLQPDGSVAVTDLESYFPMAFGPNNL